MGAPAPRSAASRRAGQPAIRWMGGGARPLVVFGLGSLVLMGLALWWVAVPERRLSPPAALDLGLFRGADPSGFATPSPDWTPTLPADHAAHPEFAAESWTLSASLTDPSGRDYGLGFAIARLSLTPKPPDRPSAWAAHQLYRAHLSLSSGDTPALVDERVSRAALGLAGARGPAPPGSDRMGARVWVRDWALELELEDAAVVLNATVAGAELVLRMRPERPVVAGDALDFFAVAGEAPPLALYLLPRLSVTGELTIGGESRPVTGIAQLDHAWGAIPGLPGAAAEGGAAPRLGRFAVQLEDGRDLLCVRLSRAEGGGRPIPACALVLADGRVQTFRRREIVLEPARDWRSPATGDTYPVAWRLALEPIGLTLDLDPLTPEQEITGTLRLWSGAIMARGAQSGTPLSGRGRIEVTATGR